MSLSLFDKQPIILDAAGLVTKKMEKLVVTPGSLSVLSLIRQKQNRH